MTAYPILTVVESIVKFQNMDPKIQMKDDGLQHVYIYATFVLPPRWKSGKGKMTAYPILTFVESIVKFQNMDPEIQMKDDGLQHIFIYATWPPRWKSWKGKMTAYPILIFVQRFC